MTDSFLVGAPDNASMIAAARVRMLMEQGNWSSAAFLKHTDGLSQQREGFMIFALKLPKRL